MTDCMTEHLTPEEMETYADLQSRKNMPSRMVEHLPGCDTCFQAYMAARFKRRKFPIVIDLSELAGSSDRHLQDEEIKAYLYGEINDELDMDCARLHLKECLDCRMKFMARLNELDALLRRS